MTDSYYINLEKLTLDKFQKILETRTLLPGRLVLREKTTERFKALKSQGIKNVSDLVESLKSSKKIKEISKSSVVPVDYLVMLRREIGGYLPKPKKTDGDPRSK